jgi:hypothetical protein
MPFLKPVPYRHALSFAGVDVVAALGMEIASLPAHWQLVTPISEKAAKVESSKFYGSISDQVNDDEKLANFALLLGSIHSAAIQPDYQAVLKGSVVSVKIAYSFTYANGRQKLWELKTGKKDRVYFCTSTVAVGRRAQPVIILFLAHHKKDQNTPKEVIRYCEREMRALLDPRVQVEIS